MLCKVNTIEDIGDVFIKVLFSQEYELKDEDKLSIKNVTKFMNSVADGTLNSKDFHKLLNYARKLESEGV